MFKKSDFNIFGFNLFGFLVTMAGFSNHWKIVKNLVPKHSKLLTTVLEVRI